MFLVYSNESKNCHVRIMIVISGSILTSQSNSPHGVESSWGCDNILR
jgi:hypothetical protein